MVVKEKGVSLSRKAVSIIILIVLLASMQPLVFAAKFNLGDTVEVFNTEASGLVVRDAPAGNAIGKKYDGSRGMVLAGPQSASLGGVVYTWWKVRWGDDALEGWSAEGYPSGVDYLKKISVSPSTKFSIGNLAKVSTGGSSLTVRTDPPPSSDLSYKGSVADGTVGKVVGGSFYGVPQGASGFYHFWKVDYLSIVGWSAEDWLTKVVGEPTVTSSLRLDQSPPYYVGNIITARFTITNRATASFTFDVLTVGGRDPDNQVADFTWITSLTLNPGASYNYQGTLTLTKVGNYHFFCAYRTLWGDWNPAIPTEGGATNTLDIYVQSPPPPNNPPYTPYNPSPSNHATGVSIYADLSWSGGDPDAGDTVTYDVYFGVNPSPPLVSAGQSATSYDPGTLGYGTTYYWKIVAKDNHGAITSGPVWDFTTQTAPPPPNQPPYTPYNPSPLNHATAVSIYADLSWSGGDPDVGDTVTYDIYFGTSTPPPLVSNDQSETTYDPGTLSYGTAYNWKIVATDNHGASTEGPIWDFTTQSAPPPPDFSISASPTSLSIQQGSSGSSTITVTSINGFNQLVQLTVSGVPSGVTATLNPQQVTPPAGGSTTSTLTVSVATSATPGSYPLTVTGISGALTRNVDITVEITTVPQVTAAIDTLLLNLIDQYANSYFDPAWDITIDQYKAWIATIAWGEGGKGGYVAHSHWAPGSDVFNHRVVGSNFRFSTGIGSFQLDNGGYDNWQYWPTIRKLNPEEAVKSTLKWHYRTFGADVNLKYFADNSVWNAVKGGNAAGQWEAVTGTSWDVHNKGKVSLDWSSIKNQLSQNAQSLEFRYETNVKDMGVIRWSIKESDGIKTDTGNKVIFDGDYQTWLITARDESGKEVFQYYYTFDQLRGIEVWAWNNFQYPVNKFRYIFVREYTKHQFPEHRDTLLGVAGEALTSPAIVGDEVIAKSPVDLIVTDPEGLTITKNVSEVPGMFYNEFDLDGDGHLDDVVTILHRKLGNYSIWVVPEPEAIPTDTFTLVVSTQTQTIVLAENVAIGEIPSEPYIFEYTSVLYTFSIVLGEETFIVSVKSNSTVSNFAFNQPDKEISFNVTGPADTIGFCNVAIPKALLYAESSDWIVLIDGALVPPTITENATHSCLYFTYTHSTHEVQIIGTWAIPPPPPTYSLAITTTVGGTTNPSPGTYSYTANSSVPVTAIPNADYAFDHWELDTINVGSTNPYTVLMDNNHTLKAVFTYSPPPPPLTASISPLSASILVGQSVTFSSTVSGGYIPYSYQWYLNGNPVSVATSPSWTLTPTASGIYYIYLKVTDAEANTAQSETARITVATVPVGGYSFPIQVQTKAEPVIPYIALILALTAIFTKLRPKTKRKR
jgi:hypothetical protein